VPQSFAAFSEPQRGIDYRFDHLRRKYDMCHEKCIEFAKDHFNPLEIRGKRVLEVGSRNVNGSVRDLVESLGPAEYVGVDMMEGPGVDQICDIGDLVNRFGPETFDVVITTELLEHVRDWRTGIENLKRVLRPGGAMLITTRSRGFEYHGYPYDFWRYEVDDMRRIFADFAIVALEKDPLCPGIFLKANKRNAAPETNLAPIELYSIVTNDRRRDIRDSNVAVFQYLKYPIAQLRAKFAPSRIGRRIRRIFT
jgi:SAM-dependent methyltransferase